MITGEDLIEVETVSVEKDFELSIRFSNGQQRKVDLSSLLRNPPPVFAILCNMDEFRKVSVNPVGGVQWECGADLSADYLLAT
jgi:hypothetical protein